MSGKKSGEGSAPYFSCRRGAAHFIWVIGFGLLAIVWLGVLRMIHVDYEENMDTIRRSNTSIIKSFDEEVRDVLTAADSAARYVKREYEENGVVRDNLQFFFDLDQQAVRGYSVEIIDDKGDIVVAGEGMRRDNIRNMPIFYHQQWSNSDKPYIGHARSSQLTDILSIPISWRINKKDGGFGGIVAIAVDPAHFDQFYRRMELNPHQTLALVGTDGIVRSNKYGADTRIGQNMMKTALFTEVQMNSSGHFLGEAISFREKQLMYYQVMKEYPLIVVGGIDQNYALEDHVRRRGEYIGGGWILSGFVFILCYVVNRKMKDSRQLQEELAESNRQFRELVQAGNQIVMRMSPYGEIRFINDFGMRFFGFDEEELIGRNVVETIVPGRESTGRNLLRLVEQTLETPEKYARSLHENIRKTGNRVWVEWSNTAMRSESGELYEILAVGIDVTERVRFREMLRESREKYMSLFQHIPYGVAYAKIVCDSDGRAVDYFFLESNTAFATMMEKEPDVFRNRLASVIFRTEGNYHREWVERYAQVALSGESLQFEEWDEGKRRFFSFSVYSMQPQHFIILMNDITEIREAEKEIREGRERYQAMVRMAVEGIAFVKTGSLEFVEVNPQFLAMVGYEWSELLGRSLNELMVMDELERKTFLQRLEARGCLTPALQNLRKKNGEIAVVERTAAMIPSKEELYCMCIFRNLTQERCVQIAIETEVAAMGEAQRQTIPGNYNGPWLRVRRIYEPEYPVSRCVFRYCVQEDGKGLRGGIAAMRECSIQGAVCLDGLMNHISRLLAANHPVGTELMDIVNECAAAYFSKDDYATVILFHWDGSKGRMNCVAGGECVCISSRQGRIVLSGRPVGRNRGGEYMVYAMETKVGESFYFLSDEMIKNHKVDQFNEWDNFEKAVKLLQQIPSENLGKGHYSALCFQSL